MIGRGLDEKRYTPGAEVLAAGDSSRLTPEGCRVLVTGENKVKRQLGKAQHPAVRACWLCHG